MEFSGRQSFVGVDIRQVVLRAILLGAEHVVFAHNHPSGTLAPSKQDIAHSIWCEDVLNKLGIKLLDSIVVTSRGANSIKSWREHARKEQEQRELDEWRLKRAVKRVARPHLKRNEASPAIALYLEIKAANPGSLLIYRMGDFYELFFNDAEVAAKALGIVLTKRGKHHGEDIPMCGTPVERAQEYLHRLISLGHCVAVCE